MNYKIKGAINRNRTKLIICIILWLVLTIVFVSPLAYSIYEANITGSFDLDKFLNCFIQSITNPFGTLGNIFSKGAIQTFLTSWLYTSIVYLILYGIGFFKSMPKNEYTDIEHGSSDWSQHGEQYSILSNKKGIILAENNYLPVNKRGNVNVLVVGRIRVW